MFRRAAGGDRLEIQMEQIETVFNLFTTLCEKSEIRPVPENFGAIQLKLGFPPKPMILSEELLSKPLSEVFGKREAGILEILEDKIAVKEPVQEKIDIEKTIEN